jgi:ABC-type branched-subunit amino acid transport system permease subunit
VDNLIFLQTHEVIRFTSEIVRFADALAANLCLLLYGPLLVIIAHFRPRGLAGEYRFQ